jgi:hypothetical protein
MCSGPAPADLLHSSSSRTAKRVTIENPTDAIAMLQAEDAFDVRDRLPDIQTDTLVICSAQDPF